MLILNRVEDMKTAMSWHQRETGEVLQELGSSPDGLSEAEAQKRFEEFGPNELEVQKKRTPVLMFLDQFRDFMIIVLISAALVSGIIGKVSDTVAIIAIVILNAIIGFVQEYRAERAMEALRKLSAATATVLRGGNPVDIPVSRIVPGEVVVLEAGRVVPADMRLIEVMQLRTEEAALTGESLPAEKHPGVLREVALPISERRNMGYRGTTVSHGRGKGVVVATGMATEIGRIAAMLGGDEEVKTPLQKRLARFGQKLAIAVLAICAIIFGAGMIRGERPLLMFLTSISLAVAAIPEALPAVVTISLALGARKMVRQNALIRKLPAVETLGSVTYICSDKTGTLTRNRMTVEEVYVDGERASAEALKGRGPETTALGTSGLLNFPASALLLALALSNDARTDRTGAVTGDPLEMAFYLFAKGRGFIREEIEKSLARIFEIPFDPERKCMTTFHELSGSQGTGASSERMNATPESFRYVSFTKGAAEVVIGGSDTVSRAGGLVPIDRDQVLGVNERMAAGGLRVLGIAMKKWRSLPEDMVPENTERGLVFIGLVGMMDVPKDEVKDAVAQCKAAGVKPVMITGDHPRTAESIARMLGILEDDAEAIMTGRELEEMPLDELEGRVEQIRVYARVAPEQKLKIVRALQDKGQLVAMTGDGINDAPALQRADIGIAMGVTGTDVAKESAHMILLDDNFATIVKAVREGRNIYGNIRKFVKYLLTTNSGEVWTLFLAPLAGMPIPLLPIQILWMNLMTDGLPALALSVEPEEDDVMLRPPRPPREGIFAHGLGLHALWVGLLMAGTVLLLQAWAIGSGRIHWRTMVFTVLCLTQLGHVLAIRSERESLFRVGLFSNKALLGAVILSFGLQLATIYAPFLNPVFRTEPLTTGELLITLVVSSVIFFAVEFEKLVKRRWRKDESSRNNSEVL